MFFRFILLIIIILLIFQLIGRILFGITRRSFNQHQQSNPGRREGEVYVDAKQGKKKKIIHKSEGEYIRYEEIKDDK
jgi:uncharacterized protein YneF (UPF0154 family)